MQLTRGFYKDAFKLPNQSKQSAKYNIQKMEAYSNFPIDRKTEW